MSLFVRHGKAEEFCELFDAENGDIYTLIPHDEVMSSHIFGGGVPHPLTESFIGDFLAVAKNKRKSRLRVRSVAVQSRARGADAGGDPGYR